MSGPRNKYLSAQEEQQRLEKLYAAQAEFMRSTILHLSAAAHGLDETLDGELVLLKEKIKGAAGSQVVEQMERVQLAVKQFERTREQQNTDAVDQFASLVEQLLELKLPGELRKQLQRYRKNLQARLDTWRIYPTLVSELASIQKLALNAATKPPQNLWQRLKGGKNLASVHEAAQLPGRAKKSGDMEAAKPALVDAESFDETDLNLQADLSYLENTTEHISKQTPEQIPEQARQGRHEFELPEAEDSYQQVARRITKTLTNLIANIESNELIKHKVDIVKARLQRGMDWFALAVTLEDIRDILMQRYLIADKEFSEYLQKVNNDLNSIREKLGLAVETGKQHSGSVNNFSQAVSQHVSNMRSTLEKNFSLHQLKTEVTLHLDEIHSALEHFRQKDAESNILSEQLHSLLAHVQTVESEAQNTKVLLEQARHKAMHDALTNLPNREAWSERVWQEYQRFKRYQHPLTLAVCDIDHFKKINDNYGHQAGDKVLKLFAKILSTRLRKVDFVGRFGGEEFVILLPETDAQQALSVLDKIRAAVSATPFRFHNEPVKISASFGIAGFLEDDHIESVFARADKALYAAKNQGRNRCIVL